MKLFPPGKNTGILLGYFAGFAAVLLVMLAVALLVR
ncbi:hypothetical protein SAMN05421872_10862 [Nocardioides lianchengensis]|uniref:Uncharacterized protein n=1 Tax=Nocardioides lianchengensis TaxID=1045774 RepID=A0A1G6USW6_9ACTN|nr:hypothetical protein [Nocardioides lianchengensis]SDD43667.1 hypothetical protein SAMN05421872_10862 [Nocardioides lianchengensis]